MPRLLALFLAVLLVSGSCSTEKRAQRQLRRYADDLKSATPVPPDPTGRYAPDVELDALDGLLRKYPGKVFERVVVRTDTIRLPGRVVYTTLPTMVDTLRNRLERDSLLAELSRLAGNERADSELKSELARLKSNLLAALNRRGYLPDTTVRFPQYGLLLQVRRLSSANYEFRLVVDPQSVVVPTVVQETRNERLVYIRPGFWRWWQAWLLLTLLVAAVVLIVRLLLRPTYYFTSPPSPPNGP